MSEPIPPAAGGWRNKSPHRSKQDLSAYRSDLLELMQSVNFGWIEHLSIVGGEPLLDPGTVVVREHKFCGENGPRPELDAPDFLLKKEVVELFAQFDELRDGVVDVLYIKHGLPFLRLIREVLA